MMLVSSPNTISSPPIVPDQNGFTAFPSLQFGECCGPIASTIAGLGASSSSTFASVAPEANLVDVKVMDDWVYDDTAAAPATTVSSAAVTMPSGSL
jgi:hypothetical protein